MKPSPQLLRMPSSTISVLSLLLCSMVLSALALAEPACASEDFTFAPGTGIQDYLPEHIMNDPDYLANLANDLQSGKLVVIYDAFPEAMAEKMHNEIYNAKYTLHEDYLSDGFHFYHHNIYDPEDFTGFMNDTIAMFDTEETKSFMTELTGSDCDGPVIATASHYHPGDHSLPHTDHLGQRTVAFIWHLSKNWTPEWGGALYWCPEKNDHAYVHASFNTLTMFVVSEETPHFVTTVSPYATEKRLAFNGWFHSAWEPNTDQPLEDLIATPEQRSRMTFDQYEWIQEIVNNRWLDEDRHDGVEELYHNLVNEWFTPPIFKRQY